MSSINMRRPTGREKMKIVEYRDSGSMVAAFGARGKVYVNRSVEDSNN